MKIIIDIFFGTVLIGLAICTIPCFIGMFLSLVMPIIKQFKRKQL